MSVKSRGLLVLAIVLVGIMLVISGGCQPTGIMINSGQLYTKTITTSDTKDDEMHAHVYNLDVADGDTYRIEIQSVGMSTIMLWVEFFIPDSHHCIRFLLHQMIELRTCGPNLRHCKAERKKCVMGTIIVIGPRYNNCHHCNTVNSPKSYPTPKTPDTWQN